MRAWCETSRVLWGESICDLSVEAARNPGGIWCWSLRVASIDRVRSIEVTGTVRSADRSDPDPPEALADEVGEALSVFEEAAGVFWR